MFQQGSHGFESYSNCRASEDLRFTATGALKPAKLLKMATTVFSLKLFVAEFSRLRLARSVRGHDFRISIRLGFEWLVLHGTSSHVLEG